MDKKCKKCGGSGDMFVMEKGIRSKVVAFRNIEFYEKNEYRSTGNTVCCSVCNGLGMEEIR